MSLPNQRNQLRGIRFDWRLKVLALSLANLYMAVKFGMVSTTGYGYVIRNMQKVIYFQDYPLEMTGMAENLGSATTKILEWIWTSRSQVHIPLGSLSIFLI